MDGILSAALYARVSSQRQADELTIRSQVAITRRCVRSSGGGRNSFSDGPHGHQPSWFGSAASCHPKRSFDRPSW